MHKGYAPKFLIAPSRSAASGRDTFIKIKKPANNFRPVSLLAPL